MVNGPNCKFKLNNYEKYIKNHGMGSESKIIFIKVKSYSVYACKLGIVSSQFISDVPVRW